MIHFILLFSRQGKIRLQKWYEAQSEKDKKKITRELTSVILTRKPKMSNFLEWKGLQVKHFVWIYFISINSINYFDIWMINTVLKMSDS